MELHLETRREGRDPLEHALVDALPKCHLSHEGRTIVGTGRELGGAIFH
jgi:hypothetical protein